ncbi:hypothetical protein NST77_01765 [Niallia sp. FSL W8-0177]
MKAKNCSAVRKSGVHKGNESQKELGCKKKGVHRGNESQKELGCKKKWCS